MKKAIPVDYTKQYSLLTESNKILHTQSDTLPMPFKTICIDIQYIL